MTKEEKEKIINAFDERMVQPKELMNLMEMSAYIKGYEDARDAFFETLDRCYSEMKTD